MKWTPWMILLFLIGSGLAGCEPIRSCDWAEPIRVSSQDDLTPGTARQILTHNETGADLCRNFQ